MSEGKHSDGISAADAESSEADDTNATESVSESSDGGNDAAQIAANPQEVNTEDLGVWLKSIRMGKYLDLFVANEIDVDVLTELTDDDLKELEIPLGSRRRLLKAVEEADNLRAEVAMAVSKISRSSADAKSTSTKEKKSKKKKTAKKKSTKADKRSK